MAAGFQVKRNPAPVPFRGQRMDGYGSKISTDYMIRFHGDPVNRWYRVYCMIFSNVGSLYVIRKGEKVFVNESDLMG